MIGVYAGLRPLLAGESDSTSKLSREHAVAAPVPGVVTVAGGKYTTYRVMARDAVDAAVRGLDTSVQPCCTEAVPLLGAEGFRGVVEHPAPARRGDGADCGTGRAPAQPVRVAAAELRDLIAERPELGEPLSTRTGYLKVEAVYAAAYEGALHLDDILARRTRISIETWDRGVAAATEVAGLVAPVLGWGETEIAREIEHYDKRVDAERESQNQPDDLSADAARLGAPDVRMGRARPASQSSAGER